MICDLCGSVMKVTINEDCGVWDEGDIYVVVDAYESYVCNNCNVEKLTEEQQTELERKLKLARNDSEENQESCVSGS